MVLLARSKQGASHGSTAIPRGKRLRSDAELVVTVNSPAVKDGSHETVGGSRLAEFEAVIGEMRF